MKTRNVLKSLLAALLLSSSANAQYSISGKVTGADGENLTGALVVLDDKSRGANTRVDGSYTISNLPSGEYLLLARFFGYEEQMQRVTIGNSNVVVNFTLNLSFFMQDGIEVRGIRATEKTPTTYTNLDREEIERQNFGQDLPFLLQSTPSTVVTSDAGAGIGYTGVSIRGVDPTRTNVTVNGIPLNDSESQGVYWVNMPDFASSIEDMQIQRGVGTSSNGAGAFGASININSNQINKTAYGEVDNSYGTFNTWRNTVKAGTGLINDKFTMDARLSRISSDGYVDRGSANLRSYYLSGAWLGKKSSLRAIVFGGHEVTYQAWYGTPESRIRNDEQGMLDYAGRNGLTAEQTDNLLTSGRTYNFYDYENEVDNYKQDHYQLHFAHQFNKKWNANVAAHYTYGRGYYEQFRQNDRFSTYGFEPYTVGGSAITFSDSVLIIDDVTLTNPNPGVDTTIIAGEETIDRTDLIRRRWLDNHFYGGVFNINYNNFKGLELTLGGGANAYDGDHFGEVIWAQFTPENDIRDRYYDNNAFKIDANVYLKGTYEWKKFTFFADAQLRVIDYTFLGNDDVSGVITEVEQNVNYTFFNPKAGLSYKLKDNQTLYASYAVANREPVRRDFRESSPESRPQHETLYNVEAGYRLSSKKGFLNANFYLMDYDNQLVLTGQINDVGGYTRTNVKDSYRAGIELEGGYKILDNLGITGNLTLSQNKIVEFTEYMDAFDVNFDYIGQVETVHQNTDLAFSPNIIAGLTLNYEPIKNLRLNWMFKHVGAQFLDNTSNTTRMLDSYFISHLNIAYTIKDKFFKETTIGLRVNNLFNEQFENNGYTWGYIYDNNRVDENFYYPQAGTHFLLRLTVKF